MLFGLWRHNHKSEGLKISKNLRDGLRETPLKDDSFISQILVVEQEMEGSHKLKGQTFHIKIVQNN